MKKLDAFNGEYIRMMPLAEFIDRAAAELPDGWDRADSRRSRRTSSSGSSR